MASRRSDKKAAKSEANSGYAYPSHVRDADQGSAGKEYSRNQAKYSASGEHEGSDYSRSASTVNYAAIRRKKSRRKKVLIAVLVVVLVLVLGGGGAVFAYINAINGNLSQGIEDPDKLLEALVTDSTDTEPFYMLLMGTDRRNPDEDDRSDTIILTRVDPKLKRVVMISIPRDTRVYLDGYGYNKINAAHAFGGAAGAVEAVEDFAGVQIKHYAEIDFNGFSALVDALGGVEVNVPIAIDDGAAGGVIEAGVQTLDGYDALVFCRSRDYAIGDFQRQANQRVFLQALASKILSSDPATMLSAIEVISRSVATDMDFNTIAGIAGSLDGLSADDIYTYSVPSTGQMIDNISYVVADDAAWQAMMQTIDAGELPEAQDASIAGTVADEYNSLAQEEEPAEGEGAAEGEGEGTAEGEGEGTAEGAGEPEASTINRVAYGLSVRNGGGIAGSAGQAATILQDAGYSVVETGNTSSFEYDQTLVVYNYPDDLPVAQDIVNLLGKGTPVESGGNYLFTTDILVVVGSDWAS